MFAVASVWSISRSWWNKRNQFEGHGGKKKSSFAIHLTVPEKLQGGPIWGEIIKIVKKMFKIMRYGPSNPTMGNQEFDAPRETLLVDCLGGKLAKLFGPVGDRLPGEQGGILPSGEVLADLLADVVALEDLHHPEKKTRD